MGFVAGGFIWGAVQNAILLIVVASLFIALVAVLALHILIGQGSGLAFVARFPDSELGQAKEGQYVKITGVSLSLSLIMDGLLFSSFNKEFGSYCE